MLIWLMYMMGLLSGIGLGVLGAWVRIYRGIERGQQAQREADRRQESAIQSKMLYDSLKAARGM